MATIIRPRIISTRICENIFVKFETPVNFSFENDIEETCSDNLIELNPQIENAQYSWSTGDTSQTLIPNETDLYSLEITSRGGCKSSDQIYVIIHENETHFQDKTIFEGESYQFYNKELTQPGIYTYIDSTYDCPQKFILNLNVLNKDQDYSKLTGAVHYDETNQLGGVIIFLNSTDGITSLATQTESNGSFIFSNVPPGNYYLQAMVSHLNLPGNPGDCYYQDASFWSDATIIQIISGENTAVDIDLQSRQNVQNENNDLSSYHTLSGSLFFSDEDNYDGIFVDTTQTTTSSETNESTRIALFLMDNDSCIFFNSVLTNQNGEYLFQNIPPGDYMIVVDIPGVSQQDTVIVHLSENGSFEIVNFTVYNRISVSASINEWGEPLKIFPNPCTDFLQIENLNNGESIVKIYNLSGRCLIEKKISGSADLLDVRHLCPGVYILSLENKTIQNRKFIVH